MELQNFKNSLQEYQEMPSVKVWEGIESRLQKNKETKTIKYYKLITAASLLAFMSVSYMYYQNVNKVHTPGIFASNSNYSFMMVEDLNDTRDTDGIYSIENVQKLNMAYHKTEAKNIKVRSL